MSEVLVSVEAALIGELMKAAEGRELSFEQALACAIQEFAAVDLVERSKQFQEDYEAIREFISVATSPYHDNREGLLRALHLMRQEFEVVERLLSGRQQLLDAIPECPVHGSCLSHALEWVEEAKELMEGHEAVLKILEGKGND